MVEAVEGYAGDLNTEAQRKSTEDTEAARDWMVHDRKKALA